MRSKWANVTEDEIKDKIPFMENRLREYSRLFHRELIKNGYTANRATYDGAGNCLICGEAGRCPGWHIKE